MLLETKTPLENFLEPHEIEFASRWLQVNNLFQKLNSLKIRLGPDDLDVETVDMLYAIQAKVDDIQDKKRAAKGKKRG
jgi:hypothetical protein